MGFQCVVLRFYLAEVEEEAAAEGGNSGRGGKGDLGALDRVGKVDPFFLRR